MNRDSHTTAGKTRISLYSKVLGVGALSGGVALVTHIVAGFSLPLALVLTGSVLVFAVGLVWWRASSKERVTLARRTKVGLLSGLIATGAYDISRFTLSKLEPSPYNPFEAISLFGVALVGLSVPRNMAYGAGTAFHVFNGVCFGTGYCFLFGRRGTVAGIVWGFFLELFQLALYPGWLDIRFYREFVSISVLGHVMYGAVLGICCRYGLRSGVA